MPQNPRENLDPNVDLSRADPASNTSPISESNGHVRMDSDDLHEKRIERLGQFLSDSTRGELTDDVKHPGKNFFPIDGGIQEQASTTVGQGSSNQVKYTDLVDAAKKEFDELKNATAFDADILGPTEERPTGHYLLEGGPKNSVTGDNTQDHKGAHTYVAEQIKNAESASRWAGVGRKTISSDTLDKNPFFNKPIGAPTSLKMTDVDPTSNTLKNTESVHSERTTYSHGGSFREYEDRRNSDFWDKYFARMSRVGAAMTIKATGRDSSSYNAEDDTLAKMKAKLGLQNIGSMAGGAPLLGYPEENDLGNHWSKKEIENMYAGHAFEDIDTGSQMTTEEVKAAFGEEFHTKGGERNTKSWGQTYSWDDQFEPEGFPILENRGVTILLEMAQIYLFCVVRAAVAGLLIQGSRIIQSEDEGGSRFLMANPEDPQKFRPDHFFKGSSRYNSILSENPYEKAREKDIEKSNDGTHNPLLSIITKGAKTQATKLVTEEVRNLTRQLMREIGLYIPTNLLTQLENKKDVNLTGMSLVYVTATVGGLAELSVNILGADFGKSLGFWRSIFKEVARSRAEFVSRIGTESIWLTILDFLGKDDKCTGFMNYLAMLGDKTAADGVSGPLNFPLMKVPLDFISDYPSLRVAKYRQKGSIKSTTALTATPSLYLMPSWLNKNEGLSSETRIIDKASGRTGPNSIGTSFIGKTNDIHGSLTDEEKLLIKNRWQTPAGNNRFSTRQVQLMEDQLEAEYMPFYLQDLRTNEIISFHAFLTSLSDAWTGEWSAQKGFGRLEAVQTYGGANRSIGLGFTMVATSSEDFDELWWKANKLVTMVYPQWSKGTTMKNGDNKFVQPFSQVMTASPLARLRVGDLFTSNYSKENMARMLGADDTESFAWSQFTLEEAGGERAHYVKTTELINWITINETSSLIKNSLLTNLNQKKEQSKTYTHVTIGDFEPNIKGTAVKVSVASNIFLQELSVVVRAGTSGGLSPVEFVHRHGFKIFEGAADVVGGLAGSEDIQSLSEIPSIFTSENPIIKSFESTMGRGIAVAINSISFDYKMGSFPWELEPGNRAPRWIDVTLGVIPIHDITPGLDHKGFNRAPVYKVGEHSKGISGDSHYGAEEYNKLLNGIKSAEKSALSGHGHGETK